jgi:hypothetical protein
MAERGERKTRGEVRPATRAALYGGHENVHPDHHRQRGKESTAPTLSDLGVSRLQSSRWQKLADVPQEDFETQLRAGLRRPLTPAAWWSYS